MRLAPAVCVSIVPLLSAPVLAALDWAGPLPEPEPAEMATDSAVDDTAKHANDVAVAANWAELMHAIEVLEHGDRAEKLALFEEGEGMSALIYLDEPPGEDERAVRALVSRLRDWFRTESDVLVLDLAAQELAYWEFEEARPIVSDLATHRAPSLRSRAIAFALELEDDEDREMIEAMWEAETVPWLRAELLEARMALGSWPRLEECAAALASDDADLAGAAMTCLANRVEPEAGEQLAAAVSAGSGSTRLLALEALTQWFDSNSTTPMIAAAILDLWRSGAFPGMRATLYAVLHHANPPAAEALVSDLVWDEDDSVAKVAVAILGSGAISGAPEILMARAREGSPGVRAAAIEAMDRMCLADGAVDLLVRSLERGEPQDVRVAAARVLGGGRLLRFLTPSPSEQLWAPRFSFAGILRTLADSDPDAAVRAAASESPLVAPNDPIEVVGGPFCSMTLHAASEAGPKFAVRTTPERGSVRCYRLPGIEPSPEDALRIPVGDVGSRDGRFDDGVVSWVLLDFDAGNCWLRQELVERVDAPMEAVPAASIARGDALPAGAGWQVDLPLETTNAPWFLRLEAAGIVERFDPGEMLIGVAVTDPLSASQRAALLARDDWRGTPLAERLRQALGS